MNKGAPRLSYLLLRVVW